jgi:hypothetical protein
MEDDESMSFDLAFWYEIPPDADPGDAYVRFLDGLTGVGTPTEEIDRFYQDVTAVYPDLEIVGEDDVDVFEEDDSPWAAGIDRTEECMVVAISWSRRDEVTPVLLRLAHEHGLVAYDPQQEVLYT